MSESKRQRKFLLLKQLVSNPRADPPVEGKLPCSAVTWWRWVKDKKAPQPYQLGPNMVAWASDEIDDWIDALPRGFIDRAGQFESKAQSAQPVSRRNKQTHRAKSEAAA